LLVEDESDLRALVQEVLEDHGYVVLSAGRPSDALQTAERHQGPIELLVTDVVMPEMSGCALAERLVSLRPEMAVLYMSGYTEESGTRLGLVGADVHFLQKPFPPDAVPRMARVVLDSATRALAAASADPTAPR
jgi:DNA-binding response OmpR family regulator